MAKSLKKLLDIFLFATNSKLGKKYEFTVIEERLGDSVCYTIQLGEEFDNAKRQLHFLEVPHE